MVDGTIATRQWDWDKVGISLSTVCVVHCVLTPLAFLILPAIGYAVGEHTHGFHWFMLTLLLPVALVAFYRGWRHHHRPLPLILGVTGVAMVLSAVLFFDVHEYLTQHFAVNIAGSAFLLLAHVQNRRCHSQCQHNH
jgi:hypothetical protein